ncbi:MAG TPA: hypothetical protein PKY35_04010 [Candidatus Hydrogenedentes bacterium]|nr:hypothetical protein [Candidatus Hydrogenedentota bacterium]HOL76170.1 hypothetical protein [Candidatus Hydrogenedentota bacterium]HPO84785.1 hypothetical protein [Candidatus Hydrogenedentota bacterium]
MTRFAYTATDESGNERFGILECANEADAIDAIRKMGLYVTDVHPARMTDELRARFLEQREQRKLEEQRRQERLRAQHPRQRLVVRYADGRILKGVCFALNPKENFFHLDEVDQEGKSTGKTIQVRFSDLKAVFHVRSFDGNFDRSLPAPVVGEKGTELIVEFQDGEIIRGFTLRHYDPDAPRFFLIPEESDSNNISILVERKSVAAVYTPEEWKRKQQQQKEGQKQDTTTTLTQEETLGDFYFDTRNYPAALAQYELALRKQPHSSRLRSKILASQYNVGVQYIKRREYAKALEMMEKVLKADPKNPHALKKKHQLQRVLERGAGRPEKEIVE